MKRLSACILTFSLLIGLSGAQPASVWAQSTDTDETDPPVSEEGTDDSAISEFLLSDSDDPVLYRNGGMMRTRMKKGRPMMHQKVPPERRPLPAAVRSASCRRITGTAYS